MKPLEGNPLASPSSTHPGLLAEMSTPRILGRSSARHAGRATMSAGEAFFPNRPAGSCVGQSSASVVGYESSATVAHTPTTAPVAVSPTVGVLRHGGRTHTADNPREIPIPPTPQGSGNPLTHHLSRASHSGIRGGAAPPRAPDGDVVSSQDTRSSRHSIEVLGVTRDSAVEVWAQPSSSTTPNQWEETRNTPAFRATPEQRWRRASPQGTNGATQHYPTGTLPKAGDTASSGDTSSAPFTSVRPPKQETVVTSEHHPRPPEPQQRHPVPSPRSTHHHHSSANSINASLPSHQTTATRPPRNLPQAPASLTAPLQASPSITSSSQVHPTRGESPQWPRRVPHRSPHPKQSQATTIPAVSGDISLRYLPPEHGTLAGAEEPRALAAPTLQVSTTTLTKTTKKVRYILPDEVFNPDAPDPSDIGGITAEEEAALLNPVSYTLAVDEVVRSYPMLLRHPSAKGGDLPYGRERSDRAPLQGGMPHPTFLLDDGNRWARATNRPSVATTRNPSEAKATARQPAPRILQQTRAADKATPPDAKDEPFPAHQFILGSSGAAQASDNGDAGVYLLQRHVQQTATGTRIVRGTAFECPPMKRWSRDQPQLAQKGDSQNGATATEGNASLSRTLSLQQQHPQTFTVEDLYSHILQRAQQNRRTTLPTTVLATAAPPQALPFAPAAGAGKEAELPREHIRGHSSPPSATPTPLRRDSSRNSGTASHRPLAHPPPRSFSQSSASSTLYPQMASSGKEGGLDGYRTSLPYAAAQDSQRLSTSPNRAGVKAASDARPRASALPPPLRPERWQPPPGQPQHVLTPSRQSSLGRSSLSFRGEEFSATPDAPPRDTQPHRQQQLHSPSPLASPGYTPTTTTSQKGNPASGVTSDRPRKYNDAASAPPLPPPHPPVDRADHASTVNSGSNLHHSAPISKTIPTPSASTARRYSHVSGLRLPPSARAHTSRTVPAHASQPQKHPEAPQHHHHHYYHHPHHSFSVRGDAAPEEEKRKNEGRGDRAGSAGDMNSSSPSSPSDKVSPGRTSENYGIEFQSEALQKQIAAIPSSEANVTMAQAPSPHPGQRSRATYVQETPLTGEHGQSLHTRRGEARPRLNKTPTPHKAVEHVRLLRAGAAGTAHEARPYYRTQLSSSPMSHRARITPAATPSAAPQSAVGFTAHSRGGVNNVSQAAGAAVAYPLDFRDSLIASQVEPYELATSVSSRTTGTQPVAVSERGDDDSADGDDDSLVKKGTPVLIFGDEVVAPEGYEYVEESDDYEESYEESDDRSSAK